MAYVRYLWKTVWPAHLAIFYPLPARLPGWQVASAALLLVAVSASAALSWRRARWLTVGWCWFLGTLVPVIGLVQVGGQAMADRYTYFALLGLFIIPAWGGHRLLGDGAATRATAAAVVAALAGVTWFQFGRWVDDDRLFGHAIEVAAPNARAQAVLATSLLHRGRLDDAEQHAREALAIEPFSARHRLVLAMVHFDQHRLPEASEDLLEAVQIDPRLALAWSFLGEIEGDLGRQGEAIEALEQLVPLTPTDAQAWNRLNVLYGRASEATSAYARAVQVQPRYVPGWRNLGVHLTRFGAGAGATRALRTALQLAPRDRDVAYRLGLVALLSGNSTEALEMAARLDPLDPVRAADLRNRTARAR